MMFPSLRDNSRLFVLPALASMFAASSVTADYIDLGEISVTASRVAKDIQDTPASISIVDSEELNTIKFTDATHELMKRIPGYSMSRNLRIPMGGKNYTANLIDGVSMGARFGSNTIGFADYVNTFDIERVEVLRGPASALYGSNAIGGAINLISRTPPLEPEYRVWGELGEYSRSRGGVSAAGTKGAIGYFFDVNTLDYEGWQDRSVNERDQASGKLLFDLSDSTRITLRAEYVDRYLENPGRITQAQYDADRTQALVDDAYNHDISKTGSIKIEHDFSDRSGIEITYGYRDATGEGPPSYSATGSFGADHEINQNLVGFYRHSFDFYDSLLIVGADILDSSAYDISYGARIKDPSDIDQEWDTIAEGFSPFFQYEISPTDWLRFTVGARRDKITYSAVGYDRSIPWGGGAPTYEYYDDEMSFSNTTPKAGATFKLDEDNSLWFSYGQGFVVPGKSQLWVGGWSANANPNLLPEEAEDFEMGLRGKIQFMDSPLSYDVALYYTKIKNMIVVDDTDTYANAGKVRIKGIETMLSYQPVDDWRFDIAHTYADNKYLEYDTSGVDYSGNTLAYSPKHHLNARVTWMPIHGLSAELEMNHISEYYTSTGNDDPNGQEDRPDVYNLRVNYETGPWEFWGHVLNLTDREYAERITYSSSTRVRSFDVGGPRTFYAGVSYNW